MNEPKEPNKPEEAGWVRREDGPPSRKETKRGYWQGVVTGTVVALILMVAAGAGFVLSQRKSGEALGLTEKAKTMMEYLDQYYIDDVDYDKLDESVYRAIADSQGDPYTTYMNAEEVNVFLASNEGSFYGIGVVVSMDPTTGELVVNSVLEDSASSEAGILPGDIIVGVDGEDVAGKDLDYVVGRIRGEKGTEVTVTVERDSKEQDFTLKRAQVTLDSVSYEMLPDNVGYIRLTQFRKNSTEQFQEALDTLKAAGMQGLIVDLRNNPGGLVDTVEAIGNLLVPQGLFFYTIDYNGNREDHECTGTGLGMPLVLLVNGGSASASEILAGAVKDRGVGTLVGTQTFGKGVVQQMYFLGDGSAMKITMQRYYTPSGASIHKLGIAPDVEAELAADATEDTQLQKAREVILEQMGEK